MVAGGRVSGCRGLAVVTTYDRLRWPLIIHRGLIVLSSATTVSKFEKKVIYRRARWMGNGYENIYRT